MTIHKYEPEYGTMKQSGVGQKERQMLDIIKSEIKKPCNKMICMDDCLYTESRKIMLASIEQKLKGIL